MARPNFPPHLISISALPYKTGNMEITFFFTSVLCCFDKNTRNTSCEKTKCHPLKCLIAVDICVYNAEQVDRMSCQ